MNREASTLMTLGILCAGLLLAGCGSGNMDSQAPLSSASKPPAATSAPPAATAPGVPVPSDRLVSYFTSQFTITNGGTQNAFFSFTVNDQGPYGSLGDLIAAIDQYPDQYPGEPLYRKAWRFVAANDQHYYPLGMPYLKNQALLYLNSRGFGFCSDVATVLSQVWQLLGYPARVWGLNGHVVPEVFANGEWHMLDADLDVYYVDANSSIASVAELEADPSLITSPLQAVSTNPFVYSQTVADIYATTDDNAPYPQSMQPKFPEEFFLMWELPPGANLTLPVPVSPTALITTGGIASDSSLEEWIHIAVLTIPSGWGGDIGIPLDIQDISGAGTVSITDVDGQTSNFSIGSQALEDYINARTSSPDTPYFYQLHIVASGTVKISYFINSDIMELGATSNEVTVMGSQLGDLQIDGE